MENYQPIFIRLTNTYVRIKDIRYIQKSGPDRYSVYVTKECGLFYPHVIIEEANFPQSYKEITMLLTARNFHTSQNKDIMSMLQKMQEKIDFLENAIIYHPDGQLVSALKEDFSAKADLLGQK